MLESPARWLARLARAGVCALALLSSDAAAQATPPVEPPPTMLNAHHGGEHFYASADGQYAMRAEFSSEQRSLTIVSTSRAGSVRHKQYQSFPVRYWPTCVRAGANGELWVAGKGHRTGNTIIEKWTFSSPSLASTSTPGVNPLTSGSLNEVKDLYDASVAGRSLVENMAPILSGTGPKLLVQFQDSKAVCALAVDGSLTRVASPVATPNAFHCPLLAGPGTVFARRLASGGDVYGWRRYERVGVNEPSTAVMYDDDRNGTIDRVEAISAATFDARNWGRAETWLP